MFVSKNANDPQPRNVRFSRIDTANTPGRFVSGIAVDPAEFIETLAEAFARRIERDGGLVDQGVEIGEQSLGERHADAIGESLTERSGRRFDSGREPILGMPRRLRFQLAEMSEVVDRQLPGIEPRILASE